MSRLIQLRKKFRLLPPNYSQWGQANTQLGTGQHFIIISCTWNHLFLNILGIIQWYTFPCFRPFMLCFYRNFQFTYFPFLPKFFVFNELAVNLVAVCCFCFFIELTFSWYSFLFSFLFFISWASKLAVSYSHFYLFSSPFHLFSFSFLFFCFVPLLFRKYIFSFFNSLEKNVVVQAKRKNTEIKVVFNRIVTATAISEGVCDEKCEDAWK